MTPISFSDFARPVQNWTPTSSNKSQTAVQDYDFIECCSTLMKHSSQIPYFFWFHVQNMQCSTSSRDRGRGMGRGSRALLAGPSCFGSVIARNETKLNSSHQVQEAGKRNLRAATPHVAFMNPCNEPQLFQVSQTNLITSTAPPDNFQLERFEDMVCDETS